jgi:hypothetical protein
MYVPRATLSTNYFFELITQKKTCGARDARRDRRRKEEERATTTTKRNTRNLLFRMALNRFIETNSIKTKTNERRRTQVGPEGMLVLAVVG